MLALNFTDASKIRSSADFYEDARKLINLALKGAVSATEIEAWLLTKRSARLKAAEARSAERMETSEPCLILNAHTVRMNETVFNPYLESLSATEAELVSVKSTSSRRLIPNQEEDIELLDDNKGKDDVGMTGVNIISTTQEPSCIDSRESERLEAHSFARAQSNGYALASPFATGDSLCLSA